MKVAEPAATKWAQVAGITDSYHVVVTRRGLQSCSASKVCPYDLV